MSLLVNMLSGLAIVFLSRSKMSFHFMAAVTICSDFGAQENKVRHCFHCLPISLPWGRVKHSHPAELGSGHVTCLPHKDEKCNMSGGDLTTRLSFSPYPPHLHLPRSPCGYSIRGFGPTCSDTLQTNAALSVPGVVGDCTISQAPLTDMVETQGKTPRRIFGKKRKFAQASWIAQHMLTPLTYCSVLQLFLHTVIILCDISLT